MLTSSTQLQNWSFHDVERTRTSVKCQKMKNARAKRAKMLFFIVKYANLWGFCCRRRRGCLSSLIIQVERHPVTVTYSCIQYGAWSKVRGLHSVIDELQNTNIMTRSYCVFIFWVPYTSSIGSIVIYCVFIVLFIVSGLSGNSMTLLFLLHINDICYSTNQLNFSCLLMNVTNLLYADKNPRSLEQSTKNSPVCVIG